MGNSRRQADCVEEGSVSGYGFRLYTVKLVNGRRKSKAVDFDKCGARGDRHVSVWVRRALQHLEGFAALTGAPQQWQAADEDGPPAGIDTYIREPAHGEYRTKFLEHSAAPASRVFFKLEYGRAGKVSVGVQTGESLRLSHLATGDVYRGILYLPADGNKGLLALESVPSAPNPQRFLNAWLARAALDLRAEDEAYIATLSPEEAAGARPHPFKLNFNQYPNVDRIEKAVANNPAAKLVLKKESVDGAGTPSSDSITLNTTFGSARKRSIAGALAGRMVKRANNQLDAGEEPVTLADLEDLVEGSMEGIEWTEGYIQIDDETGVKNIGLEAYDKFFVYPVGSSVQLDDRRFEQAVAAEVVDLQAKLGLELDLA